MLASDPTDTELVRRSLRGERSAFAQIVARYRDTVSATAYHALGNADDAQDAAQEAFIYAYQHLTSLRDSERLLPWLRSITVTRSIDLRRRKATRAFSALPDPESAHVGATNDPAEHLLEQTVLEDALQHLPEAARTTFRLFHDQGHSLQEVALLLNIPINTVRSRLQAARRTLHTTLSGTYPERITTNSMSETLSPTGTAVKPLPENYIELVRAAFPDAEIKDIQWDPEPWMPTDVRIILSLSNGFERSVDIRGFANLLFEGKGTNEDTIALLSALKRAGLPVPELLAGPIRRADGSPAALCTTPTGENLLLWAFDGNPLRIRRATDLGIAAIEQLHGVTEFLAKEPIGAQLPRRTLADDLNEIIVKGGPWLDQPAFAAALQRLRPIVDEIAANTPLVYTNDLYFPNFLRVHDDRITEFIQPFGWFGDPMLGLAKFRTYDCYPFVHTGFIERYLFEKGYTRREFAPRLAVRALWTLQRETPAEQMPGENAYRDNLLGHLAWAIDSLQ